jgi:hypothetical protein
VSINREAPPDKRSYRVDFSLFRTLAPGHVPEVTLADTIKELRSGLQAMRFNNADFRNSSFMRLKVLEQLRARCLLNNALEWVLRDADAVGSRVASSSAP